ncbi:zinc ribbon domain-containing protein [uncultured Friedmanniella sp.]|uniref:zinc ribbon domain-containing protein n=1 Tax=uncultured Friedmanniella sp. TaxID=335381 RepID=UPI0035CC5A22
MKELSGLIGGIRLAYGVVGVVTTLAALATNRSIAVLNTMGVAGVVMLVVGGSVWQGSSAADDYSRVRNTAIAMSAAGAIAGLLMFFGRPLDENEKAFGLLTFIGVVNVIAYASLLSLGLAHLKKRAGPAKKVCPECANEVLAAARKCQFCQYRFEPV